MKKRFALVAALLFAFSLASPTGAVAKEEEQGAFAFHAGDEFIEGATGERPGNVTRASSNGDTITVIATGEFRLDGRKASGTGSFAHRNAAGATVAVGSFTAGRLRSFTDFGTPGGFPFPTLHGGKADILIHVTAHPAPSLAATVKFDALLTIDCAFGRVPPGVEEGITLVIVTGPFAGLAFDQKVSGFTVFVAENEKEEEKD